MKVKNNIEFLTFNDGAVTFYQTDGNDDIIPSSGKTFAFGSRKIGINRFYLARHNDIDISLLIHIHFNETITPDFAAVIGTTRYKIEQLQTDFESHPKATVLSLSQHGEWIGREPEG